MSTLTATRGALRRKRSEIGHAHSAPGDGADRDEGGEGQALGEPEAVRGEQDRHEGREAVEAERLEDPHGQQHQGAPGELAPEQVARIVVPGDLGGPGLRWRELPGRGVFRHLCLDTGQRRLRCAGVPVLKQPAGRLGQPGDEDGGHRAKRPEHEHPPPAVRPGGHDAPGEEGHDRNACQPDGQRRSLHPAAV